MKKILLSIVICFYINITFSQINGSFLSGNDNNGNRFLYFQGRNTTEYNIPIRVACLNEKLNQKKDFNFTLIAGGTFSIGPNQQWIWQPGEKLVIIYPNGHSVYWINQYNFSNTKNTSTNQSIICKNCNGTGMVNWFDGSVQTCPSCNGSGKINMNNPVIQDAINATNEVFFNGKKGGSSKGKTRGQIQLEIQKTVSRIQDNEYILRGLMDRNEHVTIWPKYSQLIRQDKETLENLQNDLNNTK